jgi:hypothetical protein
VPQPYVGESRVETTRADDFAGFGS